MCVTACLYPCQQHFIKLFDLTNLVGEKGYPAVVLICIFLGLSMFSYVQEPL